MHLLCNAFSVLAQDSIFRLYGSLIYQSKCTLNYYFKKLAMVPISYFIF